MDLAEELREGARRDLTAESIVRFGEVRLRVTGTSMFPCVWPGDVLTVHRRSASELQTGKIVLCYRKQAFVAHRLIGKDNNCLITRGDSLSYYDPPFRLEEVLGEVTTILRDGHPVALKRTWWHGIGSFMARHSDIGTRAVLRLRRLSRLSWAG